MRIKFLPTLLIVLLLTNLLTPLAHAQAKPLNLSPQAKQSIRNLSVDILTNGNNPGMLSLKPQLDPGDYQIVKNIGLLPDNPFYFLKSVRRSIRLFLKFDPSSKASKLLKDGNEKTLESLLLIEKVNSEKDPKKHQRLINLSAKNLDQVGSDFDSISQTLDKLKKDQPVQAYLLEQEAFTYSGYWLKHQILLQKQADQLSEQDFLTVEQARNKHLGSVAHIVVSENENPLVFSEQLSQLISPQVGSNYSHLATIAILRDLENNAVFSEQKPLRQAQALLQKELEIKLDKLSGPERLKLIKRYISFIHGNPIRQFQAYNQISQSFTSKEMALLTSALKDKAAQNFKKHLDHLDNETLQKQFVAILFSSYPVDLRLLFYTEIQLGGSKVLAAVSSQKEDQSARLQQIKTILSNQICQNFGRDSQQLAQTRFYTQNINNPDILDLKVAQFLAQSIQKCDSKSPASVKLVNTLQTKISNNFALLAKKSVPPGAKLPTKIKAEQILKDADIQVKPADEQQVAEEIIEETNNIEEVVSLETIQKTVTDKVPETVSEAETIIEEIITSTQPTEEEITQKEEEIIEQIEEAAASGEISPLVEELPTAVQEEISQETGVPLSSPTPLPKATLSPTPASTSQPAPLPTIAPTPAPTIEPVPTEEPTLIETVTETASESTPAPTPEPAPTTEPITTPSL